MSRSSREKNPYGIRLQAGWRETTLAELVNHTEGFISTGPFGSQLHAHDYKSEGIPVVMPQQLGDNQISLEGIARISDEDRDRLSRHVMQEGDIVFSRRGDVTRRSYIGPKEAGWICGTGCLLIRVKNKACDNRFLALFLSLPQFKQYITQKAVGATMPNLNQGILGRVPLVLPRVDTQRRIVDTLSAYDEAMENNRRRMGLLENSARLLYEEWFVRLRFPGHEHTPIAHGLPQGWEKKTADNATDVLSGGTPKTDNSDFWNGEIPFYTPKDAADGFWVTDCERAITELGLENCSSRLYPKETVFISARGTVGKLNLAQRPMAMSQSCYALMAKGHLSQLFLFSAMQIAVEELRKQAVGAVFDAIIKDTFTRITLLIPEPRLVRSFDEIVKPIFAQLENLTLQNKKLRAARDLLLPRLMSGEIEV